LIWLAVGSGTSPGVPSSGKLLPSQAIRAGSFVTTLRSPIAIVRSAVRVASLA